MVRRPGMRKGMVRSPVPQVAHQHTYGSVHAAMPSFQIAETSKTGVAPISGNLTASYPRITGFNTPGKISTPY